MPDLRAQPIWTAAADVACFSKRELLKTGLTLQQGARWSWNGSPTSPFRSPVRPCRSCERGGRQVWQIQHAVAPFPRP